MRIQYTVYAFTCKVAGATTRPLDVCCLGDVRLFEGYYFPGIDLTFGCVLPEKSKIFWSRPKRAGAAIILGYVWYCLQYLGLW